MSKDEMLYDKDNRPGTKPVCHEQQEIGHPENLPGGCFFWLIHIVISSIGTPASSEAIDSSTERNESSDLSGTKCRSSDDRKLWSCDEEHDHENGRYGYPGPSFVAMDIAISIDTHHRCQYGNNENTCPAWNSTSAQCSYQLAAYNNVHH